MQRTGLQNRVRGNALVAAACGASLALGLFFVFVWAPHPWGWEGFDRYHELALTLAAGQPFPTMEVPWGYAYFAAALYRIAGDHPAILLVVQVLLNAALPWLVYRFATTWTDERTARVAAVITGIFSFNTVYASTQSSDAMCTVIFMTALVVFAAARRRDRWALYAVVGLLTGLAAQFRPNLILVPLCLAAYAWLESRSRRRALHAIVLLGCAGVAITPWVARNYRLTRTLLPTSVHGGVQLWYGTLQTGPYLHSRVYSPRKVFDAAVFNYTSLDAVPIIVTAHPKPCGDAPPSSVTLVYWTDRDPERRRLAPLSGGNARRGFTFEIPPPGQTAAIYYYFDDTWHDAAGMTSIPTPPDGAAAPFVYFVTQDHLGDADAHGDLLDVFDLIRIARHAAWREPLPFERELARAGIGPDDLERAVDILARTTGVEVGDGRMVSLDRDEHEARLTFRDGSSIAIPRSWSGRITDLVLRGPLALAIMSTRTSLAALTRNPAGTPPSHTIMCAQLEDIGVNDVFYRSEPQMMRRYSALAFDNIRRDPAGFVRAAAYRAARVFVIQGTDDHFTSQQFARSSRIYLIATAATLLYLLAFIAGAAASWRRGDRVMLPLLLVAYVPLTIAPVLTNMRYSVTVQPIVFIFIAAALTSAFARPARSEARRAGRDRAGSRTAPAP
jgi:hypothetical protein